MKHISRILCLLIMSTLSISVFAQSADNEDEVVKIDKWNQQAFREGEILVKFKTDGAVQMRAPKKAKFQTAKVNAVDALFAELGVDSIEQLMPRTGHKNVGRRVKAYNGSEVEVKDLSKLYRLTLKAEKAQNIHEAIDKLKSLDEVEFAEPNYIVYAMALPYDADVPTADSATYVNEPLYSQQWGIPAINLPQLWNKPKKSSKRPVIAILDTGVDIEHPDLAANIWTNSTEANGIVNQDDDANGFADDIHGWDFINKTGNIRDFNGHGTHCAGIAAAVGNNGIGITGANPDAYIMPVTVMQSNGTGDVATIIKGIDYAASNGADVISMSLGSYAYSVAEEQALGHAYANAVLVAAAGNDFNCIIKHSCPTNNKSALENGPMFPAAFSFVLGVEASVDALGNLASFSNYDEDGPIFSTFSEDKLYNYELRAPGVQILSTFPKGRYKNLNGTSMACPLAAGAISRLIQCKEIINQDLLFGDLIHTRNENVNILSAYNIKDSDRHPELALLTVNMTDTANGDGDRRADAGETIEFYPIFKNSWGQAENIRFWIKTGFDNQGEWIWDDTTLITHMQDTAYFGKPLSSYAKATSLNPWRMAISPDCTDGRNINLSLFAICDNAVDTMKQQVVVEVENGIEIGGLITEDLTLYPNVHYIITRAIGIPEGVTLTVKPGVCIRSNGEISIEQVGEGGALIMKGTKDSLITLQGTSVNFSCNATYEYINVIANQWTTPDNQTIAPTFRNCILPNAYLIANRCKVNEVTQCKFYSESNHQAGGLGLGGSHLLHEPEYCIFAPYNCESYGGWGSGIGNVYAFPSSLSYYSPSTASTYQVDSTRFLGACTEKPLRKICQDYTTGLGWGTVDFSTMCKRPSRFAHGTVWKVLIDNVNAFDDFDLLPPLGVGTHKCEVYFNRAMDTIIVPFVSYGVRKPYTQHIINEQGSWSADSTTYTAYFTIDAKTVSDGLNQIYVADAQDDEHFEIFIENARFQMEIAAAGSMSTGLMAESGLGKVTLTWETDEEDFADLLGYNIYRWTYDTIKWNRYYDSGCKCYVEAGWRFDTLCINSSLIDSQDTAYIDYDVVPGKAYYYVIRQMTTSMNSYDLSNPVTATPLSAIKGDANGSMSVDVADVITEVNYITHQNPQPFIFEAADVNSDDVVNVIDVVATVNLILHPQTHSQAINNQPAFYYIENGILYVENDVVLGGVQCTFNAEAEHPFVVLDALKGFETVSNWQTENDYLFMAYSMSGKTLEIGKHALLQIGDAELINIVLSDAQGHNIPAAPRISQDIEGNLFLPCSTKYIQDGHMYIKIGDHIFNAIGTMIK